MSPAVETVSEVVSCGVESLDPRGICCVLHASRVRTRPGPFGGRHVGVSVGSVRVALAVDGAGAGGRKSTRKCWR